MGLGDKMTNTARHARTHMQCLGKKQQANVKIKKI